MTKEWTTKQLLIISLVVLVSGILIGYLPNRHDHLSVNRWLDRQPVQMRHDFIYTRLTHAQRRYIVFRFCSLARGSEGVDFRDDRALDVAACGARMGSPIREN